MNLDYVFFLSLGILYFLTSQREIYKKKKSIRYLPRDATHAGIAGEGCSRPNHGDDSGGADGREDRYDGGGCKEKFDRTLDPGRSGPGETFGCRIAPMRSSCTNPTLSPLRPDLSRSKRQV